MCDALSVSLGRNAETSEPLMSRYTPALTVVTVYNGEELLRNGNVNGNGTFEEVTNHASQPRSTDSKWGGGEKVSFP